MRFHRTTVAVVLLASLVVIAGCLGGGGTPAGEDDEDPAASATASPAGSTATGSATGGTPTATPAGTNVDDAASALERHRKQLAKQAGAVATLNSTEKRGQRTLTLSGTVRLDPATGEMRANYTLDFGPSERYFKKYSPPNSDRIQSCRDRGDGCSDHVNGTGDPDVTFTKPVTNSGELSGLPTFEDRGVVQTARGRRHKFVAEGTDALSADETEVDVESFRMVLYFDPETGLLTKLVSEITYTKDGETVEKRTTITYEYRSIDVQQPDWYLEEE